MRNALIAREQLRVWFYGVLSRKATGNKFPPGRVCRQAVHGLSGATAMNRLTTNGSSLVYILKGDGDWPLAAPGRVDVSEAFGQGALDIGGLPVERDF